MNKRGYTILFCLGLLFLTAIMLLVFFLSRPKPQPFDLQTAFSCTVSNIDMTVGDQEYDFYQITIPSAEIQFELDKEDIIDINRDRIIALKEGKVNVTLKATSGDRTIVENFVVNVKEKDFTFEVICISNCTYDKQSNTLNAGEGTCQFRLKFYDMYNAKINLKHIEIFCDNDENLLSNELASVALVAKGDCKLSFKINYSNTIKYINVKKA